MSAEAYEFSFSGSPLHLHDWLYKLVTEIIYDRDYAYLAYSRAFHAITDFIFNSGALENEFSYTVIGIKSDYNEVFHVVMKHRQNFIGLNEVVIDCSICDKASGNVIFSATSAFETSLGMGIEAQ